MLAYILSVTAGLASLFLYFAAFFLPRLHRKDDFFWSGLGLFYSLSLWVYADKLTGGFLLGQLCILTLILSFGWQNFRLRNNFLNSEQKINFTEFSFVERIQKLLKRQSLSSSKLSSSKNKKPNFSYRKEELKLKKKNIEKDKDINIFQEVRNNDCLDGEKLSNIKNEKFSFKSFLPLNQLKSLLYFNSSKNNIDKELLDPQNISPELREEVDSFEDEMIENQDTIIGYDKSSIDKPRENSSE